MALDRKSTLKQCLTAFNLGGSRYFLHREMLDIPSGTDWDFYTNDSPKNHKLLNDLGFEQTYSNQSNMYDGDDWLLGIYKHEEYNIEVLIRINVEDYKKIMENIPFEFYRDYLWKSGPNYPIRDQIQAIFNQMFRIYQLGKS